MPDSLQAYGLIIRADHEVDDNARETDIQPERHCPAGNPPVLVHLVRNAAGKRQQRQGHDGRRKDDVREKNKVVHGADRPLAAVWSGRRHPVICEVRDQEQGGRRERRIDKSAVPDDVLPEDEEQGCKQEDEREGIHHGIEQRQDQQIKSLGRVDVRQEEEKDDQGVNPDRQPHNPGHIVERRRWLHERSGSFGRWNECIVL